MSWKIILGKPEAPYIIGRRWVKKNISKTNRISKTLHSEKDYGDIYDIGMHYLPNDPSGERKNLWVCMDSGRILTKAPKTIGPPRVKPTSTPKLKIVKEPPKVPKQVKTKPKAPTTKIPEPEPVVDQPKPKIVTKQPSVKTTTSVSEVKGVGAAAYEKLVAAGIKTIGDLISKHSQEIATMIGRKSDAQIKTWQQTAKEMLIQ